MAHQRPTRLNAQRTVSTFEPQLDGLPGLGPVDWAGAGFDPPEPLDTPPGLPRADVVIVTWAGAEWAAMHHVFCDSLSTMPYSDRSPAPFAGWQQDSADMVAGPADWMFWGYFRTVSVGGQNVLLYKSNTHLDWPGQSQLTSLVDRLVEMVRPTTVLSIGTAGGANGVDHVGTIQVVSSATLYQQGKPRGSWPTYSSPWRASTATLSSATFAGLLMPIPTTGAGLAQLVGQFNAHYGTKEILEELDPLHLNLADAAPEVHDHSDGSMALLTAASFLVGTTDDAYADYACIEMDDAVLADACGKAGVGFGSVRNLSDPAQNPELPPEVQANWGGAVYDVYGLYTSLNGALVAWATVA